ncbi:unnamed protein product, partial [Meganyctiphanes norvegica]
VSQSTGSEVYLLNLSRASSGKYKCEVLADYPSFEKDSEYATMEVVDVPAGPPELRVRRHPPIYSADEVLMASCSSPGVIPPPKLIWYINGEKLLNQPPTRFVQPRYDNHKRVPDQWSDLNIHLKHSHFQDGVAKLTCAATLQGVYL